MLAPLIALLAAFAATGPDQSSEAQAATIVASPDALALARLMAPRDLRIEGELRQFDLNFARTMVQDEEVKALEAEYPGTVEAMAKAARPLIAEATGKMVDEAYPRIARILADALTGPEIAELAAYYGSPAGQNLLRQLVESADASSLYAEALKSDGRISEDSVSAETFIAALRASGKISAADRQALKDLMGRPVWPKLRAVQPMIVKVMIEASNAPNPAYDKRLEEVMGAAVEAHVAALQPQADQQK